jgi:diacylglycerol kinase family enzyme/membrane-associated phospholipid phosphatase
MEFDVRRAEPRRPGLLWSAVAVPAAVWLGLGVLVAAQAGWLQRLDDDLLAAIYQSEGPVSRAAATIGLVFSNWAVAAALTLACALAIWRREYRLGSWIALCGITVLVGNTLIKHLFDRPRPHWGGPSWWETGEWSFPSGHAAGSAALATVGALLTISVTMRGARRRIAIAAWAATVITVGVSRIVRGAHYPSDVVAGWCFGVALCLALWLLIVPQSARIPHDLAVITGTGRKRVAVIVNPIKVGDMDEFKAKVLEVAQREGWNPPLWLETTVEDPGQGQAHEALEAGVDLIVTAGGDGTVRAVCEEAARTGVAVGILPLGTGNLLARNAGLPLNFREALDVAFAGQDRAIDLATFHSDAIEDPEAVTEAESEESPRSEPSAFLVMAGLGVDAEIMAGVDDNLKKRVGWFAYFVSGIRALRFPTMRVRISVDDGPFHRFRARTVVIGNVGFLQAGIPLLPDARLDDGRLDVVVLAPKRYIGWLAILVRVMGRTRRTDRALNRMTGHRIVVECESPAPMQLDGDPVGTGTRFVAEVHHGVLLVRVPVSPAPRD